MTTVRILHAGGVGVHKQGDEVKNASVGLVDIAEKGIRNAADGELIAEIVDGSDNAKDELKVLKAQAKELKIEGYGKMDAEQLKTSIAEAEAEAARLAEEEAARIAAEEADKNAANQ